MSSYPLTSSARSEATPSATRGDITSEALHRLLEMLRAIAGFAMSKERADHTLQPTAVVNELLIKILTDPRIDLRDDAAFRAWASKAIRHFLIDHARRRATAKRGGDRIHLRLHEAEDLPASFDGTEDLLLLTEAIDRLREAHPRSAEVVTLRVFGGLEHRAIADRLDVSERTVRADWVVAKAWLYRELRDD